MELTNKQIEAIFRAKISPNDAIFLKQCQEGNKEIIEMFNNYNINISMTLLTNGYITVNETLTQKGIALVGQIWGKQQQKSTSLVDYKAILDKLKACMKKNTGKEQVEGFGGVYFRPTETELKDSLLRFWKHYPEYKDINKITKILENHIVKCSKKNSFAPAIRYYIGKMSGSVYGSPLAAAYEDYKNMEIAVNNNFDGVNI